MAIIKKLSSFVVGSFFLTILVFYLFHVNHYAGFHDSLSYLDEAARGFHFKTHATAHFLYANVLHLQTIIFPFENQALLHNVFSVCCSVLALFFLYRIMLLHSIDIFSALFSVIVLATAYTFWSQSMTIEAYPLNNLLFSAYLFLMMKDISRNERKNHWWVSLLLGLSMLVHIQNILALPLYLYYLLWGSHLTIRPILSSLVILIAIAFILFVPVVFWQAYPPSVIFFDFGFRDEVLATGINVWVKGFAEGVGYFLYNFTVFSPIVLAGIYLCYYYHYKFFTPWLLILIPWLVFSIRYDISDVYVYYLIPYMVFAVFGGLAFHRFLPEMNVFRSVLAGLVVLITQPAIYFVFANYTAPKISALDQFGEPKAFKGGYDYYFWPGRRNAPDPLERAYELYKSEDEELICEAAEKWNLGRAYSYLYFNGKIEDEKVPDCNEDYKPIRTKISPYWFIKLMPGN